MPKPKRSTALFIEDIKICVKNIENYTKGLSFEEFKNNKMVEDAIVRNLEIIGEAANNIPKEIRLKYPNVPWQKMIGMRNRVVHEYFGVDLAVLWKTAKKRIPELNKQIRQLKIK